MFVLLFVIKAAAATFFTYMAAGFLVMILHREAAFLGSHPVVGLRKERFAHVRAGLRSIFATKFNAFEGYEKYAKANQSFVIPSVDRGPMTIIPPQQIKKIYSQPEHVIDIHDTANETLQVRWTIGDAEITTNDFQMNVIRNQITRNLDILTPMITEELARGLKRYFADDAEWREVTVWDCCMNVIGAASNSMFCGTTLCRNEDFIDRVKSHAMAVIAGSVLINATPPFFKPVVGYLVSWWCYFQFRRVLTICLPFVTERLANTARLKADPTYNWEVPKDGLQWVIDECYKTGNPAQFDPVRISKRIVFLNDISLHSTSFTIANVLLDLFSTDPSLGYVDILRQECAMVLEEAGGIWNRAAVTKLKLLDSTVRESMRVNPFAIVGLPRTVVDPNGISFDEKSTRIPPGRILAIPIEPIHMDDAIYKDARTFKPFRFAQAGAVRDLLDAFEEGSSGANDLPAARPKTSATLDDSFLGFGFGKTACPGRFFALNEMKLMMAQILLNYDVEFLKERPKPVDTIWLKLPTHGGKLRVRKRVEA